MTAPIALQLHSVREALAQDFVGVMRQIAGMGYLGVEPIFKLPGTTIPRPPGFSRNWGCKRPARTPRCPSVQAAGEAAKWLIVEFDACASDVLQAVEQSYNLPGGRKLAHGKQG